VTAVVHDEQATAEQPQLWRTMPRLTDEQIENLRRLVFGRHTKHEDD
jgi:hypothetical protein